MATILLVGPHRQAIGGVGTHLSLLTASALGRQHEFVHFPVGGEGLSETALGKAGRMVFAPLRMALQLRRSRAALVHLNPSMDKSFWRDLPLLLVARLMRRPVVLQIHGGALPDQFYSHVPGAGWLTRIALNLAHRVVVLARVEEAAFGQILPGAAIALIPNAIDAGPYAGEKPQPYDGVRPLRAIYIGRIVRSKGLFVACEAIAAAWAAGVRVEFLIAGTGPDAQALSAHIEALNIAHAVRLVGPLGGAAKRDFLLGGDVFLFPTLHPEGLPYALLEAMAAGTPPITTATGAIPDVLTHDVNGVLVEPHNVAAATDALLQLAASAQRLRTLSRAARQRVIEAYSLERLEHDFGELYTEVLDANGRAIQIATASPVERGRG